MAKLTRKLIESEVAIPASGQIIYRDDDLRGFALRVTPRSKSYIVERKVNGKTRRITVARYEEMSIEQARAKARIVLLELDAAKKAKPSRCVRSDRDITLREVIEKYLLVKKLQPNTRQGYQKVIENWFSDWLDYPIVAVTKDMVEARHREISTAPTRKGTPGHARANHAMTLLKALINFASERFGTDDEPMLKVNPVERLTQIDAWYRLPRRERIIPDHKLKQWYQALSTVQNDVVRDYCLFLLLTGLRRSESLALRWSDVDLTRRVLILPGDLTKTGRKHVLPLSDFLCELLMRRYDKRVNSNWIFQSAKDRTRHIMEFNYALPEVRRRSGIDFDLTDLRRTFLSMAEKLEVPHYIVKRLSNCRFGKEITERYLVLDIERLRPHMSRISDAFVELLDVNVADLGKWKRIAATDMEEWRQLTLPISLEDESDAG